MKISPDVVRLAQAGDRSALARLVTDTQDPLFHFLVRELGSAADAEDALQETWTQSIRWLPTLRDPAAFSGWVHRIALRTARDMALSARTRKRVEADASRREPVEEEAMRNAEGAERAARVQAAVAGLEPELRTAVRLRYEQGLSYEEIAEATESPTGSVGKRLHTAHDRLRQVLAGAGVVLAIAALERELEAAERMVAPDSARKRLAGLVNGREGVVAQAPGRRGGRATLVACIAALLLVAILWRSRAAKEDRPGAGAAENRREGKAAAILAAPSVARAPDPGPADPVPVRPVVPSRPAEGKGRLTGTVRDAESKEPIGGAAVRVRPVGRRDDPRAAAETTSGADGNFVIDAAPGPYYLDAWSADHAPYSVKMYVEDIVVRGRTTPKPEGAPIENEPQYAGILEGEIVTRDLELTAGRNILGRVIDGRGFPLAGASVRAFFQKVPANGSFAAMFECEPYGVSQQVATGADGRFELPAVWPRGTVWLRVECPSFRSSQPAIELGPVNAEVTVALEPGIPVGGMVSDRYGRPVAGALVFVADEGSILRKLPGKTDERGRFADPAGPVGGVVMAWVPGCGPAVAGIEGADATKLDLRLPAADTRVRGEVRDDRGTLVPGARVRATKLGAVVSGRMVWLSQFPEVPCGSGEYFTVVDAPTSFPATTTAADGSFTLEGLPLGPSLLVEIEISAPGLLPENVRQKDSSDLLIYLRRSSK